MSRTKKVCWERSAEEKEEKREKRRKSKMGERLFMDCGSYFHILLPNAANYPLSGTEALLAADLTETTLRAH